ncbi:outer membrane lipoprotein carrier protein LolA [Parapedobacter deserti]|uniref:Outer membrane lipoprotein carrier protein LolA n=1 Tax=Parapedobacter deserti TaxID=1912957 RepID=A0ABV7JUE1_9SPHI
MRNRSILVIVLFVCCITANAQRKALTPAEAARFKERVTASIRDIRTLESDFTQTKVLSYLESAVRSSGKLFVRAPDQIRWEYLTPTPSAQVFDLTTAKRPKSAAGLLSAAIADGNIFNEERFATAYYREGPDYVAVQTPKNRGLSRHIKEVELTVDGDTWLIKSIKIVDPARDHTLITFANQRKNIPLPADKFNRK